jgi:predicted acyltransferase
MKGAIHNKHIQIKRLQSLDALRGFDMFWIISGEGIFHGLKEATGVQPFIGISDQLHHSVWNGFTFYDLIFPLFIFIAGVSMPYSLGRQLDNSGANRSQVKRSIYISLVKRTVILILLGMVVNGALQFRGYADTRFASVLGRIALSCFFAALIYVNSSIRGQIAWLIALLLGYWAAMMLIQVPGHGAGVLTPEGNLSAYIDRQLLPGKLHRKVYDPEGLFSTVPAIATALLGVLTGQLLRSERYPVIRKTLLLALAGLVLLLAGFAWNLVFPINKTMWTSSFVLYAGGWSLLLFTLFYWIIDVMGFKRWSMPFVWIGMNSILIYVAAHGLVNFESMADFIFGGLYLKASEVWHKPLMWMGVALIQFALLYFLYRKKWFLKI